jgi:hypothetical protein
VELVVISDATTHNSGYYRRLGSASVSLEEAKAIFNLGLAAVEEAGGEEDYGYDEGDAGVEQVVVAEAEEGVA